MKKTQVFESKYAISKNGIQLKKLNMYTNFKFG